MSITAEVEIARADMNDSYGVSVWQRRKLVDYTTEEARALAAEIVHAADEADRVEQQDRDAAFASEGPTPFGFDMASLSAAAGLPLPRCPLCRHADHTGSPCLNMASDNDCACAYRTTPTPENQE